jgi:periplasmic divalent cation tolerance protein
METPRALLVLSTCPAKDAARLAQLLVEEGLAACVNVVEKVESFYVWEGKLNRDAESLLLIKTAPERLEALTAGLLQNHPYEVPEVVALPVLGGNDRYLEWVASSTLARQAGGTRAGPAAEEGSR